MQLVTLTFPELATYLCMLARMQRVSTHILWFSPEHVNDIIIQFILWA